MKKLIVSILMVSLLIITSGCSSKKGPKVATIPLCNVLGHSYYTNFPNDFDEVIGSDYEYYGAIEFFEKEKREKNLSTNFDEYMDKEVYVNKMNDENIYIKFDENKYLKLYYKEPKT